MSKENPEPDTPAATLPFHVFARFRNPKISGINSLSLDQRRGRRLDVDGVVGKGGILFLGAILQHECETGNTSDSAVHDGYAISAVNHDAALGACMDSDVFNKNIATADAQVVDV